MKLEWLFLITIAWFPACAEDYSDVNIFDVHETRSRLMTVNGHMWFHAGKDKNISFLTSGIGSIWLGNTDISQLPSLATFNDLKRDVKTAEKEIAAYSQQRSKIMQILLEITSRTTNLREATKNISTDVKSLREWRKDRNIKDVRLRRFLGRISKAIKGLLEIITTDGCNDSPCQGGSTCIPHMGKKVVCLCPPHRTGDLCENDVDECATLETPCQNNGTCENVSNGYICHCPRGYHGRRCQYEHSSCRKTPGLCGNGVCVDADIDSQADYRCICNEGYKPSDDANNPTCIDVDECLNSPCHPGVDCVNLPGTFQCSGCPKGFHGNGRVCVDIDECARDDYPCSLSPKVQCFNTIGSYQCSPCPAGYRGDGKQCTKVSGCSTRPCHSLAECKDDLDSMNIGGFACICPSGYLGDGIGHEGCYQGNSSVCRAEGRCMNGGTCKAVSSVSYRCLCPDGYYGASCETVSECISSPCENGGECQVDASNGYSCICPIGFYGRNCEMEENICGRHFEEPSGNFSFPDDFGNLTNNLCDIIIQPPSNNQYLQVTFMTFGDMLNDIRGLTDCTVTSGNVTLYDGDNENSPKIKTFCGPLSSHSAPLINREITMTGSRAMLRFQGSQGYFSAKWELKNRACGYRTNKAGKLIVPSHHLDTVCEWFISAPADQYIEIEVPAVDFTSGLDYNCSVNELEIYDGYIPYEYHSLLKVCNTQNDTVTLRSVGPFLTVAFKSNILYGTDGPLQSGFEMKYRFFTPDNSCGGDIINTEKLTDFNGIITTPNWGGFYPKNIDCTWRINIWPEENSTSTLAENYISLKLEVLDFNVPGTFVQSRPGPFFPLMTRMNPSELARHKRIYLLRPSLNPYYCVEDYLRISYNGQHKMDACDTYPPKPQYVLGTPQVILQFHSGYKHTGKGFRIKYSAVCEKRLTGNGTIRTWNYPNGGHAGKCTYYISAGPSHAITLRFQTVRFSTISPAQCFLPMNNSEVEDYVEITGGREDYKQLNQRYYCSKFPLTEGHRFTMSAQKPLKIVFSSSGDSRNRGLLLEYETTDVGCGGVFTSSSGVITSPNYPEKYLPHMHCVYQINVLWSKNVRLTFEHFDMEIVNNDDCSYDRVEVYDRYINDNNKGKLLGKFCGSMLPPTLLSGRYQMTVVFISDRTVAGSGFSARYESIDASVDCDRTYTEPSGTIIFDGSSGRYGICEIHIALSVLSGVLFKINNATIPCDKGKLQIKNGATNQAPGFPALWGDSQVCDSRMYFEQLRSHGNRVYMKLVSTDSSKIFFNISYEQIDSSCGGRVSGVSGSIAAPQYPLLDTRPMECKWTVAVALGNRVRVSLVMLDDLYASDDNGFCSFFAPNRLDFLDGPTMDSRLLRRYCKKTMGTPPLDSDDHEMALVYKQQGGTGGRPLYGFLAHFTTECNGIVLTDHSGSIQSPGYPDKVYTNRYCTWTIQVPQGNRIGLSFQYFVIEERYRYGMKGCISNYLTFGKDEIASGEVKINNAIQSLNGSINSTCSSVIEPIKLESAGNVLHLTFQSKGNEENNFWLTWHTIGCGGEIITPQSLYVSKNDMDSNSDIYECFYKIRAKPGYKIRLAVRELAIFRRKPGGLCDYNDDQFSGFETYSGPDSKSNVFIDSVCDGVKNQTFQSHSNELFVRLKVHKNDVMTSDVTKTFFSAAVEFIETSPDDKDDCGGIIEVKDSATASIHSPRYPSEYPRGTYCEWIFKAPLGHRLELTLKEFHTPNGHPQKGQPVWRPVSVNNLTCQHPLPAIEGALSIYQFDNVTNQSILDRICLDITEPKTFQVGTDKAIVRFEGASTPRVYMSSEDEQKKTIGFILEAKAVCGGTIYAEDEEHSIDLRNMPLGVCNITILKRIPDSSGIWLRVDELTNKIQDARWMYDSRNTLDIQLDQNPVISRTVLDPMHASGWTNMNQEFRADTEIRVGYVRRNFKDFDKLQLSFTTDTRTCGADLTHLYGLVSTPDMTDDFECTWTLKTSPGNRIMISSVRISLPVTPNCTESYFEIRRHNESGPVVKRACSDGHFLVKSSNSYFIRARYVKPQPDDIDDIDGSQTAIKPRVSFRYSKLKGGRQDEPGIIESPDFQLNTFTAWSIPGEFGNSILISFERFAVPDGHIDSSKLPSGLYILRTDESFNRNDIFEGDSFTKYVGFENPEDILVKNTGVIILMSGLPLAKELGFRLRWSRLNGTDHDKQNTTAVSKQLFTCGMQLPEPTYEWQELNSPRSENPETSDAGYPPNQRCKWTIARPMLAGLIVEIVKMDLEDNPACLFDHVSLVSDRNSDDESSDINFGTKLCRKSDVNLTIQYTYNKILNIYFISDRNRGGSGFTIRYRRTCNSFDFIKSTEPIFNHQLAMPPPSETECSWIIVLGSNRRIRVNILEMNLFESPDCTVDYVSVRNKNFALSNATRYCGQPSTPLNSTSTHGKIFVKYVNKLDAPGKESRDRTQDKFLISFEEVIEDCSNINLVLDDFTTSMIFHTPGYPSYLANSLDCEYLLRVPTGHRLQFTVNPKEFLMESSDDECLCDSCDWLEIHDGASAHSPLVGRYCGTRAPSTVYSTSNTLFVRLRTDSYEPSHGFSANFSIASCGGTLVLGENQTSYLRSPNFPDMYQDKSDCQWTVHAPNTHMIQTRLNHLWLTYSSNCSSSYVSVRDGNSTDPYLIEPQCNNRLYDNLEYRTASSLATVNFKSNVTTHIRAGRQFCQDKKCGFELEVKTSEQGCGGIIDDNHGSILPPGYPNRLLPHVRCTWELKAGIGHRYLMELEFTDPDRDGFYQQRFNLKGNVNCFPDVVIHNGGKEYEKTNIYSSKYFCANDTIVISEADIVTVIYSDLFSRDYQSFRRSAAAEDLQLYVPFRINYTKVPVYVDKLGCSQEIKQNGTFNVAYRYVSHTEMNNAHYCHYLINRPDDYGTTTLIISNYSDLQSSILHGCSDWNSFIDIKSEISYPFALEERLCHSSFNGHDSLTRTFIHQSLDINIFTLTLGLIEFSSQKFNMEVIFQKCGGVISEPNSGVITSPNFGEGRHYPPNSHCEWILVAPEGQQVEITITDLDVEFDPGCRNDSLVVSEGKHRNVIHRYCLEEAMNATVIDKHKDRHAKIRSQSRYLVLTWSSDDHTEGRGFRLEYEFVDIGDACGFHTSGTNGIIHSPNYPDSYPADTECIWDIQVPRGYHVQLNFITFDIEASEDCSKDALTISEEHNAVGEQPLKEYFFMFLSEEKHSPLCGYHIPNDVKIPSNRMRLNFTTNGKTNGKGFKAEWKAVCGAVFTQAHYTIESPGYPSYYPNEDMNCEYLINPVGEYENSVVIIRISDLELSLFNDAIAQQKRLPYSCDSDYLEITDVLNKKVIHTFCGGDPAPTKPFAIKGAVGIKFVTKKAMNFRKNKIKRGFRLTYEVQKCGGDIQLGYRELDDRYKWDERIQSPAYPLPYPHDLNCSWNITAPSDRILTIKIQRLDLELSDDCSMDYLELYDGFVANNSSKMAKYCDSTMIPRQNLKTKSNNLLINFFSDSSNNKGGFVLVVTATLGPEHGCGGVLTAADDWKTLTPPKDTNGNYLESLQCGWTIVGPEHSIIEVQLTKIDTEKLATLPGDRPKRICVDRLSLYDGYRSFSPAIADDLCSETVKALPAFYHSSHKVLHVIFESDSSESATGFELKYRVKKNDCGSWLTAKDETQIEKYESKTERDAHHGQTFQRCQWIIQSKEQIPIYLEMQNLNLSKVGEDCSQSYLEIRDVGLLSQCEHPACARKENSKKIIRYCEGEKVAPFISNTMVVQITSSSLVSDSTKSSFSFSYNLLDFCNRTISLTKYPTGRLTSPHFPNSYVANDTCTTILESPEEAQILVVFRKFELESPRSTLYRRGNRTSALSPWRSKYYRTVSCDHDYLEISDNKPNSAKKYCGSITPLPIFSTTTALKLTFVSDSTVDAAGFESTYATVKSMKDDITIFHPIYELTGALTNMEFPNKYKTNSKQIFQIEPPSDHTCTFRFEMVSLAEQVQNTTCSTIEEYLKVKVIFKDDRESNKSNNDNDNEKDENNNDAEKVVEEYIRTCSHFGSAMYILEDDNIRKLILIFKTDDRTDNDGLGFRISWSCSHT